MSSPGAPLTLTVLYFCWGLSGRTSPTPDWMQQFITVWFSMVLLSVFVETHLLPMMRSRLQLATEVSSQGGTSCDSLGGRGPPVACQS